MRRTNQSGHTKGRTVQKNQRILLDAARKLFTEKGYASTSTEEIVRQAHVTRGALYYHYQDKVAIFAAVFDEVRADSARFIRGKMTAAEDAGASLWQQTVVGCYAFVESSLTPSMQRVIHTDGPSWTGLSYKKAGQG